MEKKSLVVEYLLHVRCTWEPEERLSTLNGDLLSKYMHQLQDKHKVIKVGDSDPDDTRTGSKNYPGDICPQEADQYDKDVQEIEIIKVEDTDDDEADTAEEPYTCEYCEQKFTLTKAFVDHMRTHVDDKYDDCNEVAEQQGDLSHLVRTHREKHLKCFYCGKYFSMQSTLQIHLRTHTGETPYHCSHCLKPFTQVSSLNRHLKTHTEKPETYTCEYCSKQFSLKATFDAHVRRHIDIFECQHCDQKLTTRQSLEIHMRKHTGEKPFTCEYCDKRFTHGSSLTKHKRLHTGERPYACLVCHKQFVQISNLYTHMRTHRK